MSTVEEDKLLLLIAEKVSSLTINKWLIQVIDNNGKWYTAYFDTPPGNRHPESDVKVAFVKHLDKAGALRAILKELK